MSTLRSAQMEELAAIGVEAVHVVAKDRYGHALYPTDVPGGARHPHLAGDYLGATGPGGAAGGAAGVGTL